MSESPDILDATTVECANTSEMGKNIHFFSLDILGGKWVNLLIKRPTIFNQFWNPYLSDQQNQQSKELQKAVLHKSNKKKKTWQNQLFWKSGIWP